MYIFFGYCTSSTFFTARCRRGGVRADAAMLLPMPLSVQRFAQNAVPMLLVRAVHNADATMPLMHCIVHIVQ